MPQWIALRTRWPFKFQASRVHVHMQWSKCPSLSHVIHARFLNTKGCTRYLATVTDTQQEESMLEAIPVVRDFPDIFLEIF